MTRILSAKHLPPGWREDPAFAYVGRNNGHVPRDLSRRGALGNPFKAPRDGTLGEVLAKFEAHADERVASDPAYREAVRVLDGLALVCWCAPRCGLGLDDPLACHAQILGRIARRLAGGGR